MCASTFSTAFISIRGPDHRTWFKPVGDLHRAGGLGQPLGERVIDTVLDQDISAGSNLRQPPDSFESNFFRTSVKQLTYGAGAHRIYSRDTTLG